VNQRRSSFVVVSVAAHAVLLIAILAASVLAPGLLPIPQRMLAYYEPDRVVRTVDIPLPSPPRVRGPVDASPQTGTPTPAAPIEAPAGITPETGREDATFTRPGNLEAIERGGAGSVDGVGIAETAPPPPAVKPPPVRLHQGIEPPKKIVDVAPLYPPLARASHVEGIVILEVVIDEHGEVTSTRVLRSMTLLDQAAVDAVRGWKFSPARLNGEAIPVVMTVTVNFTLKP
jgi:protein TonB